MHVLCCLVLFWISIQIYRCLIVKSALVPAMAWCQVITLTCVDHDPWHQRPLLLTKIYSTDNGIMAWVNNYIDIWICVNTSPKATNRYIYMAYYKAQQTLLCIKMKNSGELTNVFLFALLNLYLSIIYTILSLSLTVPIMTTRTSLVFAKFNFVGCPLIWWKAQLSHYVDWRSSSNTPLINSIELEMGSVPFNGIKADTL